LNVSSFALDEVASFAYTFSASKSPINIVLDITSDI